MHSDDCSLKSKIKTAAEDTISINCGFGLFYAVFVKRRVECVEVLFVELIGCKT